MAAKATDQAPVEAIADSEDLLMEILSRLPVKYLLRFKSVSKQWLNLISDRRFSLFHSQRHPNPPSSALFFNHSLCSSWSSTFEFIPLQNHHQVTDSPPFLSLFNSSSMAILQSTNGLVLCKSVSQSDLAYYIFNPTINQISQLPFPNASILLGNQSISVVGLNLAFDPSTSADYKVICVWKDNSCSYIHEIPHGINVYSPAIGEWKRSVNFFTPPFDMEFERGVYWNGNVLWLSHTEKTLCYDVQNECLKPLPLPPPSEGAYIGRFRYFGESRGHLHLVEIRTNCVSEFDILELDGDYMCWSVKYRVNLDVLGSEFPEMFQDCGDRFGRRFRFYAFSILGVIHGEEEGDSVLVVSIPGKILSYNFRTGITRSLCDVIDHSDKWLPFKGYNAYQYTPSLYRVEW
ncbi:hypothetical protein Ancab_023932 [Ancistrocladus abbreviatus]